MTTIASEHMLDLLDPGVCRGRLKHVFRREVRPHRPKPGSTLKASDQLQDDRLICQRCRGVLLDWDGPFVPFIERKPDL